MRRAVEILKGLPSLISRNRKTALFVSAAMLFFISSLVFLSRAESALARKKAVASSFASMLSEYEKGLSVTGRLREKLENPQAGPSGIDAVQAAADQAGINKKVKQLKPFEAASVRGYRQSGAEVALEGADIGQVVSFLYRLENGQGALLLDEFVMKSEFENPDSLEARARVRLIWKE